MENPRDDKLHKQFAAAKACLEHLCPANERTRRTAVASSTVSALAGYQAYLSGVETAANGMAGCGLHAQLAERAFEAESQLRMLIAEGLNSVNDLRDSGMLQLGLESLATAIENGEPDFRIMVEESAKQAQHLLNLPEAFTGKVLKLIDHRGITVRCDKGSQELVVRARGVENESEETRVRIKPRSGDIGRISLENFFGGEGGAFSIAPEPSGGEAADCHGRVGQMQRPKSIDAYSGMLGNLASAREAMYRHARKVMQYGHGSTLRTQDPLTVAAVVLGVAAAVYIISLILTTTGVGPSFAFGGLSLPVSFPIGLIAAIAIGVVVIAFFII
jgi:hypothetical protein